jgi:hypothetical protein
MSDPARATVFSTTAGFDSFLKHVVVQHGPTDLIGRLLLAADTAARQRGVHLSFASLDELVTINRANSDSWRPLLPVFDPACGEFDAGSALCLLGRDQAGHVVLTQAARLFAWHGTSFHDEATSLRLLYRDVRAWARDGEAVSVTAPSARLLTGAVAFTGAHWCRPDFRDKGLPSITPRIARALALGLWNIDYTCTIMAKDIYSRGVARRAGYFNVEWSVDLINTPVGTLTTALLWSARNGIIADLEDFLGNLVAAGAGIVQRYA